MTASFHPQTSKFGEIEHRVHVTQEDAQSAPPPFKPQTTDSKSPNGDHRCVECIVEPEYEFNGCHHRVQKKTELICCFCKVGLGIASRAVPRFPAGRIEGCWIFSYRQV